MPYTFLQKLRRGRAQNKGISRQMARQLRELADMFDRKIAGEFSRDEIRSIKTIIVDLGKRLKLDKLTRRAAKLIEREARQKRQE